MRPEMGFFKRKIAVRSVKVLIRKQGHGKARWARIIIGGGGGRADRVTNYGLRPARTTAHPAERPSSSPPSPRHKPHTPPPARSKPPRPSDSGRPRTPLHAASGVIAKPNQLVRKSFAWIASLNLGAVGVGLFDWSSAQANWLESRGVSLRPFGRQRTAQPRTPSNSRHSPLLIPLVSCVTASPFSIRRTQSTAFALNVAPPIR